MGELLLVRHGQASFGAEDYDVLSQRGREQAALTGRYVAQTAPPDVVIHGSLRRQRDTASELVAAAGWDVSVQEDPRWDELNVDDILGKQPWSGGERSHPAEFQEWLEAATTRWIGLSAQGERHEEYAESWPAFDARVQAALDAAASHRRVVVISSGGPIAAIAAARLQGGPAAYARIAPIIVNASVTRVINGRRGLSLLTLNEHDHLRGPLRTYR